VGSATIAQQTTRELLVLQEADSFTILIHCAMIHINVCSQSNLHLLAYYLIKSEVKLSRYCHADAKWERDYNSYSLLTSALDGVSD
jgi:hypothetical protein